MIINESEIYPYKTSDLSDKDCLVIAPHPDDESIGCGGSIMKHVKDGSRVKVIFLTSGDKGDFRGVFGNDYLNLRRESALNALSLLGVGDYEFWGFKDRELLKEQDTIYEKVNMLVREFKPALIYVPSPYEAHPDHRVAASIGWRIHNEINISVAFCELLMPLYPNILVDISEEFDTKEAAIQCYRTELYYNDYSDKIKGLNRFRTATLPSAIKYAEAFVMLDRKSGEGIALTLLKKLLASNDT